MITFITDYEIEKQFQKSYNNTKFKEFQEELRQKIYCYRSLGSVLGSISTYKVVEDVRVGEDRRDLKFLVCFNEVQYDC